MGIRAHRPLFVSTSKSKLTQPLSTLYASAASLQPPLSSASPSAIFRNHVTNNNNNYYHRNIIQSKSITENDSPQELPPPFDLLPLSASTSSAYRSAVPLSWYLAITLCSTLHFGLCLSYRLFVWMMFFFQKKKKLVNNVYYSFHKLFKFVLQFDQLFDFILFIFISIRLRLISYNWPNIDTVSVINFHCQRHSQLTSHHFYIFINFTKRSSF